MPVCTIEIPPINTETISENSCEFQNSKASDGWTDPHTQAIVTFTKLVRPPWDHHHSWCKCGLKEKRRKWTGRFRTLHVSLVRCLNIRQKGGQQATLIP